MIKIAFLKMGNSLSDCIKSIKRLCCNRFSCERPQRIIPPYYVYSFYPYSMTFCISSKFFTLLGIHSTSNPFSPNLFHCRLPKADPFVDGRCCKISQTRIARSTIPATIYQKGLEPVAVDSKTRLRFIWFIQ